MMLSEPYRSPFIDFSNLKLLKLFSSINSKYRSDFTDVSIMRSICVKFCYSNTLLLAKILISQNIDHRINIIIYILRREADNKTSMDEWALGHSEEESICILDIWTDEGKKTDLTALASQY